MRGISRIVCGAVFIAVAFSFFVSAKASSPPAADETANEMFSARLDMTVFFKRLLAPFIPSAAPALNPSVPVQGAIPRDSLRFVFRDKETKNPIANLQMQLQSAISCSPGSPCNPPVFFKGITDADGALPVPRKVFQEIWALNFVLSPARDAIYRAGDYYVSGPFQRTSDAFFVNQPYRFDAVRDATAVIELERIRAVSPEEQRESIFKSLENTGTRRLPGDTPQERLEEMIRRAGQERAFVQPTPTPTALSKQEQVNIFLKAIEEARKKAATQGNRPGKPREPSPEEINKIIELFKEAARKAAANRPQSTPTPTFVPRPQISSLPLLPAMPTPAM